MTDTAPRTTPSEGPARVARLDELRIHRGEEPRRRFPLWPWIAGALLVAGAIVGLALRPQAPRVRVATATLASAATNGAATVLNAAGYVTARRQATVSSKVTGRLAAVLVEEGLQVKEGQVLARLDPATAEVALRLAESQVNASASALAETRVRIEQARRELRRQEDLVQQGFTSRQTVDNDRSDLHAAEARLAAQQQELDVARRQLAVHRQDIVDTEIRAPFAGVVTSKDAQAGEMVSPMSAGGGFTRTGICNVVDMGSLEFDVDVNEAYIHRVHPDQPVEGVLDAYPDWRIPGHVITIVPTADRQKATVMVRIAIDRRDPRILPEMGVKVSFVEPRAAGAPAAKEVVVPRAALRRDGEHDIALVVNDGTVERRAVQVGEASGEQVRITAGLAPGDRVIIEGPADLVDGRRVIVQEEAKR